MTTLHIRSVPADLHRRLRELAQTRSRSMSAQVVTMLQAALDDEEHREMQAQTLAAIRRRRFSAPAQTPTSLELIQEDRRR